MINIKREENMSDIDNIICAINPDKYLDGTKRKKSEFKKLIKTEGLDAGIKEAKPKPASEYKLIYDSTSETLEPVYFWILDFTNRMFGGRVEKLVDNFASSPGSGHFSELQGKASQMQQEASRVLGTINNILKGVMNLIYDLKEFKIRLSHYEEANSRDKINAEAGLLALKQIWMDKVDIQRGQGSINALSSGNLNFVTLRDAFLAAKSIEAVDKELDLNERVKRILKPRLQEFFEWKKRSESELKKRFEIEKTYLKSQVEALKLNARWAKPYLKAAQQLSSNERLASNPALVSVFNTLVLELTLMAQNSVNVEEAVIGKVLPKDFRNMKKLRKYNSLVFIDFNFRGIPTRTGQHYLFGGRAEVTFKSYALNDDELALLRDKLSDSDLNTALKFIQGMTDESLLQLKIDLDEILGDETKEEKKKSENTNPFSALFSFKSSKKSKEHKSEKEEKLKELKEKGVKPDNYAEKYIRNLAEANSINSCFNVYDIYKKSHGMASFPYTFDAEAKSPELEAEKLFGLK
jgi:hypothetical protein